MAADASPAPPTVGRVLWPAVVDFYYQSVRLVPANIVWGIGLLLVLVPVLAGRPWLAILAAPLLAVPLAGIHRLATLAVRGQDVVLSDAFRAMRSHARPALLLGAGLAWSSGLLLANVAVGASAGTLAGWALATLAGWGLAFLWLVGLAVWPLLVDPVRPGRSARGCVRLAALLVLAYPTRLASLGVVAAVVAVVSTIAFAALLTISVAYVALVTARSVLPLADVLDGHLEPQGAGHEEKGRASTAGGTMS